MRASAFMVALSMVLLSTAALADVPGLINYQGTLTDINGVALDTTVAMTFSIYTDSTGGTQIWTETQPAVVVSNGIFNVLLGRVNAISDTVFKDPSRWLGVQVESDPELEPRQRIASVGYSFRAAEADTADYARSALAVSDGDWTISGNDVYSAVSGNVGIGVSSPTAKLDIRGSNPDDGVIIQIGNSDASHRMQLFGGRQNDPNPYIGWKDGDPLRFSTDQGGWSEKMRITTDGNVGIGTTDPQVKFDVIDMARFRGKTWPSTGKGLELAYDPAINKGYVQVYDRDASTWGDLYLGDGNVGIGFTNPNYKLHVRGVLGLGNTYTTEFPDYGHGPAILERFAFWDDFGGQDNPILGTMRNDDGSNFYEMAFLSKAYGSTPRAVAFREGTIGTGGTETWYIGYSGKAYFGDRVGIGTTSPSSETKLHVRTAITDNFGVLVDAGAVGTPGSEIGLHSATSKYASLAKNAYRTTAWQRFDESSGAFLQEILPSGDVLFKAVGAGANPISWTTSLTLKTDGKVGIGTSSPSQQLEVEGVMPRIRVEATSGNPELNLQASGQTLWAMYQHSSEGDLRFFQAGDKLTIEDSTGNVGIGTTSPDKKLTVQGTIKGTAATAESTGVIGKGFGGQKGRGVYGEATGYQSYGVKGHSDEGLGVGGTSDTYLGVWGSGGMVGVSGVSSSGDGVYGQSTTGYAGYFEGDVHITGTLTGGKTLLIDHPLDPENKLLRHNFVESPENLLIYRGKVQLGVNGEAVVKMPNYFVALTKEDEATVNLTTVGRPFLTGYEWQSDLASFKVYGNPNREVAWMVMADRDDPVMHQLARPVEEEKGPDNKLCDRGELLYPAAYGYPESMGKDYKKREEMEKH